MQRLLYAPGLLAAMTLGGCGHTANNDAAATNTSSSAAGPTDDAAPSGTIPDAVDPGAAAPQHPAAADVAANPATQGQVAAAAMDSASAAAAAGGSGAGSSGAGLALADGAARALDYPPQPTETTKSGVLAQDCYAGMATIQGPARPNGLAWPESTDTASIFADSKTDATTGAAMNVEPSLLMFPVSTSGTAQLTLSVPFAFAAMAEVIEADDRATQIQLQDHAQTNLASTIKAEAHRFWVAKNGVAKAPSAAVTCIGTKTAPTGSSGKADGTWAKIDWADAGQVNGLQLLERFARSGSLSQSYLKHHWDKAQKAVVYDAAPTLLNAQVAGNGYRLVAWATATSAPTAPLPDGSTVAHAVVVRTKTVTHDFNQVHQRVDEAGTVLSDVSNYDEVRASAPLVIQEYRDASDRPLVELIASGTVNKTGKSALSAPAWFATLTYSNVMYDLVNSSDVCIPVGGTVTMTTFDKEGGTQLNQIVITYASNPAALGKVDPQVTVTGDDGQATQAQWIMLNVNHRCDLK